MEQKILSHEEKVKETIHLFNQIRHQDQDLFSVSTNVPYFKLSDLYNWYPKIFNINNPVCSTKEQFLQQEVQRVIPAFEKVYPSHILNIKDSERVIRYAFVECVYTFVILDLAHHESRQRKYDYLVEHFKTDLCNHHPEQGLEGRAPEGYGHKNKGVGEFSGDRRQDCAHTEPLALVGNLFLAHYQRVDG